MPQYIAGEHIKIGSLVYLTPDHKVMRVDPSSIDSIKQAYGLAMRDIASGETVVLDGYDPDVRKMGKE